MKVAFFVHCFFPDHFYGTETYTLELAKNYQNLGHDVVVVSAIFQGEPRNDQLISHYTYQGVPVIQIDKNHLPHTRVKETYYQSEMAGVLTKVLRDVSPDLVHVTHLINHTAALLEATHALRIPTYATFTDFFGFCLNNKLEDAAGNLCAGPNKTRTNCTACYIKAGASRPGTHKLLTAARSPIVAHAASVGANLIRHLPGLRGGSMDGLVQDIAFRPQTLKHLYNSSYRGAVAPTNFLRTAYESNGTSVPIHTIHFGIEIDRSPKPMRPKNHTPVIGFIGQIAPHKGPDLLIEAYRRLPRNCASLLIYGPQNQDPRYTKTLMERAKGLNIKFEGTFDSANMANIMRNIDLLVIPSRWYENSPLVLLNALATHTPVLISNVQGMTEFVQPDINGTFFERGDVNDLNAQLKSLINKPDVLYQMAETTHFERTPQSMAAETFSIYK